MSVYYLLLCGMFLPGICGVTEWGFKKYTKYEHGDMNIIITAPHGGNLAPSQQVSGDDWPNRKAYGCKDVSTGKCNYTHTCSPTSTNCSSNIKNDLYTRAIARDLADKIKEITGNGNFITTIWLNKEYQVYVFCT